MQPYGFDKSDLPLDYMAAELRNEVSSAHDYLENSVH